MLDTVLLERRARLVGSKPPFQETRPEDYYLEIVGVFMAETENNEVRCLTVDTRSGETNTYRFHALEFEPQE